MDRAFSFPSKSNPAAPLHVATVHADGTVDCNCHAGSRGKACWHLAEALRLAREGRRLVSATDAAGIRRLMDEDAHESAIERALELFPSMTRDEAVDLVDEILVTEEAP